MWGGRGGATELDAEGMCFSSAGRTPLQAGLTPRDTVPSKEHRQAGSMCVSLPFPGTAPRTHPRARWGSLRVGVTGYYTHSSVASWS